jgi:anti-anti-sigma factor
MGEQMNIDISHREGDASIAILSISGDLDGSNFQNLIESGREAYEAGSPYLVLDMTGVSFMSSAGLVALHSIALLAQGKALPDPDAGWAAFRAVGESPEVGPQQHVKLVGLQPPVDQALEQTGMKQFFATFADLDSALATF